MSVTPNDQARSAEQFRWFSEEVHPHSASLRTYLRNVFPSVRDVDDVMQESFLRIWRARAARPILSSRAFLFKIARHIALDFIRRESKSPVETVHDVSTLRVPDTAPSAVARLSNQERVEILAEAIHALPQRCREVLLLRKFEGLSQRETASRLGLEEKTVESQLARAIARCEDYIAKRHQRNPFDES